MERTMKEQRTTALRRLLVGDRPVLVAGAHDGLSARIVEEAGFDGIWASGFEISASHGVPDANVLTMSENLDTARFTKCGQNPLVRPIERGLAGPATSRRGCDRSRWGCPTPRLATRRRGSGQEGGSPVA